MVEHSVIEHSVVEIVEIRRIATRLFAPGSRQGLHHQASPDPEASEP